MGGLRSQEVKAHIDNNPTLLPEVLRTLFEVTLFEECSNQWSLSRPMLSLILINEPIYDHLKAQIISQQVRRTDPAVRSRPGLEQIVTRQ
jgi:exportin-7